MVGNRLGYPTYVLQARAFLAGDLSCFSHALSMQNVFVVRFYYNKYMFVCVL